jgi:hypothetical protein
MARYTGEPDFYNNNMFGVGNTNVGNNFNNQMAFNPGSMLDREIKALDVMPDINPSRYDQLRQMDMEQFQEKNIPLSLPDDRYVDSALFATDANIVDDVNENETWTLPQRDWGPVRPTEALPPRGRLDRFLQRFGVPAMTQVTAADKLANQQFMQEQGIGRDPQTGRMIGGDFAGKNAPGTSAWGSANFGEMAQKWDEEYGDMDYATPKMIAKQKRMKAQAAAYAQKVAADRQERIRNQRAAASAANQMTQRRPGMGGSHMSRSVGQGGLGISASQAQAVSDANAAAGMGGWGLAHGGRVGYKTGGRVGILAAF